MLPKSAAQAQRAKPPPVQETALRARANASRGCRSKAVEPMATNVAISTQRGQRRSTSSTHQVPRPNGLEPKWLRLRIA
eukprot:12935188-Prorocentrum_lima.AAC.1